MENKNEAYLPVSLTSRLIYTHIKMIIHEILILLNCGDTFIVK